MRYQVSSFQPRWRLALTSRPGTAQRHFGEEVNIARFSPIIEILSSKQRPRKLSIFGDDGKEYKFLLKGREDLRLDERW